VLSGFVIMLGPLTAQRFGKMRAVLVQQQVSVLLIFVMGFAPSLPIVVIAALFRTALMQMSGPVFSAYMMEIVPEESRGAASSLNAMMWTLGWVVAAPISGLWQLQPNGWALIFISMATLYTAGNLLLWWYFGKSPASKVLSPES
jgi:MFS family permease